MTFQSINSGKSNDVDKTCIPVILYFNSYWVILRNFFQCCISCYGKLGTLGSIFPRVPWLRLTATATEKVRTEIIDSLGMFNPVLIVANPDRPNIYFFVITGLSLRGRGLGFPLVTKNVAPGYFHRKIEED